MNYPQIGSFRDFLRALAMAIHAMATISTNADSCLGQNSKIVLILRINFPNTRWTPDGHFYLLSSFTAQSSQNGFQNMWNIMIGFNHIISGPKITPQKLDYVRKMRITSFFAHKMDTL